MNESLKKISSGIPGNQACTFEVSVKFRQSATWQGQITWIEENKKQNFRSALEMLKLMDEAVTESSQDVAMATWAED